MRFKVGDRIRRRELDMNDRGLIVGGEYIVSRIWDRSVVTNNPSSATSEGVELEGHRDNWDAWRFEYVSPWVQSCSCGIYWMECEEHKR